MGQESIDQTESTMTSPPFAEQWDTELRSGNPLGLSPYTPATPEDESVRTGLVHTPDGDYVLIECDFHRTGGTMGAVAGERVVRAYRRATEGRLPVAQIISTGGARLQEGYFALAQMTRTASAVAEHRAAGLLSAAVFRSPTTGGVFASWGTSADLRAVSPGATIGFGGPRVVQTVTGTFPPDSSHNAASAFRHGIVDAIIPEDEQVDWLEQALGLRSAPPLGADFPVPLASPPTTTPWEALMACRSHDRPSGVEWAAWLTDGWTELNGPGQRFRIGIGTIDSTRVMVIAMDRDRSGGSLSLPRPEDFRLARRGIALAARLGMPILTLIDTPGADPSPSSEAGDLAREISETLVALADVASVTVSLCVGEGGSGGAVALAHTDTMLMLEGSVFSVIGPEAGAVVLYRDIARAPELAASMRILPHDLAGFGFTDGVLPNSVDIVRRAVIDALDPSRVGRRNSRVDAATLAGLFS